MKPLIAIGAIPYDYAREQHANNKLYYIPQGYVHAVTQAGVIPIVVPPFTNALDTNVKELLQRVNGLLLAGGSDVSPLNYHEEPHQKLGSINERRDQAELSLVKQAIALNLPILGICRGLQLINVALGGNLYQDLSENTAFYIKHQQYGTNWETPTHSVTLPVKGTVLDKVFKDTKPLVNSLHHQAVKDLGTGLRVIAQSQDNLIEAVDMPKYGKLLAVQWHPEAQYLHNPHQLAIFQWLINQAQ